jgi:hypothetical protein
MLSEPSDPQLVRGLLDRSGRIRLALHRYHRLRIGRFLKRRNTWELSFVRFDVHSSLHPLLHGMASLRIVYQSQDLAHELRCLSHCIVLPALERG